MQQVPFQHKGMPIMKSVDRDQTIKMLLSSLDIPRAKVSFNYVQLIGPHDADFFEKHHVERQEAERRAKTDILQSSDDSLWALYEIDGVLADFQAQFSLFDPPPWYSAGFGVDLYWPDYRHWAQFDYWTIDEAVCLSLGFEPKRSVDFAPRFQARYEPVSPTKPYDFFRERTVLIERASFREKTDQASVSPREFASWAVSKGLQVPSEMLAAVDHGCDAPRPKMLNSIDRRQYESAMKVILGLVASNYGYRDGAISTEIKRDISSGLADLGLSLDPKTLNKILSDAIGSRKGFVSEQLRRDQKDS